MNLRPATQKKTVKHREEKGTTAIIRLLEGHLRIIHRQDREDDTTRTIPRFDENPLPPTIHHRGDGDDMILVRIFFSIF